MATPLAWHTGNSFLSDESPLLIIGALSVLGMTRLRQTMDAGRSDEHGARVMFQ
jgi:hypothetical protein